MKTRSKKRAWLLACGAGAAVAAYAFLVEPRWLQMRRATVHLRDLPGDLEGLRIGLLTDLHAEPGRSLELVSRAVTALAAEEPRIVAVTGDFIGPKMESFRPVLEEIARLAPPHGIYAVPGNHDHIRGIERWRRELAEFGSIVDLTNRSRVLDVGRARLCLAGVDDFAEGRPSLDSLPPPETRDLTILLAHNPDQAERARRALDRVDLVLSGHTHGGQVRLPAVGALVSSVERGDLYEAGLRRRPWTQVYTSRGLGTVHIPARLLTRPEVTVLELTSAPRPPRRRGLGL
ncbi:MAG TPA: metallophosphoesterase [Longimicrobiaceae bacterium]|nr:metallophosphoesterase [Longimicrobiaceae bacterium]